MKNLLILILGIFLFSSCVSTRPAKTISKAENRIIKLNKGITNQIERYPSLINNAFTTTRYDTVKTPGDSVTIKVPYIDLNKLDSLEEVYYFNQLVLEEAQSSLSELKLSNPELVKKLQRTQTLLNTYKIKSDSVFSLYRKATRLINFTGNYEDNTFIIDYRVLGGTVKFDVKTKDKYQVVKVAETTNSINIKKHFYEDYKFYLVLLGLLVLIYFIGDILKEILNKVVENIVKLIRKLIFKI